MTHFPIKGYRIESSCYQKAVETPSPKPKCSSCNKECGHEGVTKITYEWVYYNHIQEYDIIGENQKDWFAEVVYTIDSDSGDYERTDIEIFPKDSIYLDKEVAEKAMELLDGQETL